MSRMIHRRPARRSAVLTVVVLLAGSATAWQGRGATPLGKYPFSNGTASGAAIALCSRRPETRHAAQNETTTLSRRLR